MINDKGDRMEKVGIRKSENQKAGYQNISKSGIGVHPVR
jgi:hypothetical protein